jgi:hypothetical protein
MNHKCADPEKCGRPQVGPGHPRTGWINVKTAGTRGSTWWCSTTCLITGLLGVAERPDVGRCPLCINRHDRDHRCGVCNTQPHIARPAPRPVQLYDQARQGIALLQQDQSA